MSIERADFEVSVEQDGTARIVVNGEDVSERVDGAQVILASDQVPRLVLRQQIGAGGISGRGIVTVAAGGEVDEAELIVHWLANLDPERLSKAIPAATGGGLGANRTIGAAAIHVLTAWAKGEDAPRS